MENVGVKAIASDMNLSSSLLYKWCQPNNEEDENGTTNPLDRVAKIFEATGDENLFANTHRLVAEFSDLLREVSQSYDKDGDICKDDARRTRREWKELKGAGESFVKACEKGFFKIEEEKEPEI